jgi:hypothetical protein
MIAGVLALMLVSADTTMRFTSVDRDTSIGTSATVDAPVGAPHADAALRSDTAVRPAEPALGLRYQPAVPLAAEVAAVGASRLTPAAPDTVIKKKRGLVEYSEWYGRRVALHKALSWSMLPLFATSYYTGERLARDGRAASPEIVRTLHPFAAYGSAAVFGVNTVTGLWNLWAARKDPEGRTRRIIHSALFIVADAGFTYAGSIGRDGRENGEIRDRHRAIALSSMGVSTVGWLIMLIGN